MATLLDDRVTGTFRALGDPLRLAVVEHLSTHGEAGVGELAALFPVSLQAVSRHVKVLEAAGVVSQHRQGRHRPVVLERPDVAAAARWLDLRLERLEARYGRLDAVLADLQDPTAPHRPGDHR